MDKSQMHWCERARPNGAQTAKLGLVWGSKEDCPTCAAWAYYREHWSWVEREEGGIDA